MQNIIFTPANPVFAGHMDLINTGIMTTHRMNVNIMGNTNNDNIIIIIIIITITMISTIITITNST